MKLMLLFTFFLIINCQLFSQDYTLKKEKIPTTSEDLINVRINEGKTQLPSDNELMRLMSEQFLGTIYVVDEWILQQWNIGANMWDNFVKFDPIYSNLDLLIDDRTLIWNGTSWENSSRYVYTYTGTNLEATRTYQFWGGADWVNSSRVSTNYDVSNRPIEYLDENWTGASWENTSRYLETYDTQGNLETETYQTWTGASWDNSTRTTYTYNTNDLIIEVLTEIWSGGWVNWIYNTRTYNAMGNILTQINYIWSGGAWQNNFQYMYTYDSNGNNTIYLAQEWDPVDGWVNYGQYLYQFDGNNNQTEQLLQLWNTGTTSWVNQEKINSTYNSLNSPLTTLYQLWNTGTGWENTSYIMDTYDVNNNLSERVGQNWDGAAWVNSIRQTGFIWKLITDVGDDELLVNEFKLFNNYPNPFNPSTTIKFNVPSISDVTIRIYDVLGNEIETLVNQEKTAGTYEVEFNSEGISSGIYLYRITAGDFTQTKKMILLK